MSTSHPFPDCPAAPAEPVLDRQAATLAADVHELVGALPGDDDDGLRARIGRAASAVQQYLAESAAAATSGDRLCHLALAKAALAQLELQLLLAVRTGRLARPLVQEILGQAGDIGYVLAERSAGLRRQRP